MRLDDLDGIFCCDDLERPYPWLDWSRVTFVNHHTAHAAASFFASPYDLSGLLVVDGHGSPLDETAEAYEVETISIGRGEGTSLSLEPLQTGLQRKTSSSWRHVTQNSIGWFYSAVTMALGFGPHDQGKSMGLAAYGTPALRSQLARFVEIEPDGRFRFDPYGGIWDWLTETLADRPRAMQIRADLAYAAQEIFVDAIVAAAEEAYRRFPPPSSASAAAVRSTPSRTAAFSPRRRSSGSRSSRLLAITACRWARRFTALTSYREGPVRPSRRVGEGGPFTRVVNRTARRLTQSSPPRRWPHPRPPTLRQRPPGRLLRTSSWRSAEGARRSAPGRSATAACWLCPDQPEPGIA